MRRLLHFGIHGGVNHVAIVVGRIAKPVDHFLADHFGYVVGINLDDLSVK